MNGKLQHPPIFVCCSISDCFVFAPTDGGDIVRTGWVHTARIAIGLPRSLCGHARRAKLRKGRATTSAMAPTPAAALPSMAAALRRECEVQTGAADGLWRLRQRHRHRHHRRHHHHLRKRKRRKSPGFLLSEEVYGGLLLGGEHTAVIRTNDGVTSYCGGP